MQNLLSRINSPEDLRKIPEKDLPELCAEIRGYMVDVCSHNPGHLGSSLGAVELIVALHYVLNTPEDKIVFDVGHQAYAHKIITGRREEFRHLREENGISGFPCMSESTYDAFGVGHSSTSISAALGLAEAARLQGRTYKSVAFIGDGALTGGLAFEGLNNAGASGDDILVILNDNNQSIDPNKGGIHEYLLHITTSRPYNRIKTEVWNILGEGWVRKTIQIWLRSLKSWFVKRSGGDIFEALGVRYFGPVDGHDVNQVIKTLQKIKDIKGPKILHCITTKGKGYPAAEANPVVWHAPGKFNPETGEREKVQRPADRYQDVFGEVLCELAASDNRVVGITPAMASGCGMNRLAQRFPDRFFDVGIEEEHAVTFSAGLAAGGMRPFCNIYSAFSQRAYDQIIHDVALQKLPVVLCFDRAGLVGEDGATHNGAFDLAAYRSIPNCTVSAPRNETELKNLMHTALSSNEGPFIIRYPRGMGEGADWKGTPGRTLEIGRAEKITEGDKVAVIAIGPVVNRAAEAAEAFPGQVAVYDFKFLKPLDETALNEIGNRFDIIITLEDGCLKGGLYGAVAEYFASAGKKIHIEGVGIPDAFIGHARQADQRVQCGLDRESIEKRLKKFLDYWK